MKRVVIARGGRLIDILDAIYKALIDVTWFDELNELISDCKMYKEEERFKERISFHHLQVKTMKSQVLNRKPMLIKARTTC